MAKLVPLKPLLVILYGFPGSGKTYFARQLCDHLHAAHVQGDRIRSELYETPRYDKQENAVVTQLMDYMTGEFLNAGISVVYDTNAMRFSQRRALRDMSHKLKVQTLLIWVQIDTESAFARIAGRDRRKVDDKFAMPLDRTTFDSVLSHMQNPLVSESYIVISGKHTYTTQQSAIMKRLRELGLIQSNEASAKVIRPDLVNLIPNPSAGRVDLTRRNIVIR
jgi:predicted kinase